MTIDLSEIILQWSIISLDWTTLTPNCSEMTLDLFRISVNWSRMILD